MSAGGPQQELDPLQGHAAKDDLTSQSLDRMQNLQPVPQHRLVVENLVLMEKNRLLRKTAPVPHRVAPAAHAMPAPTPLTC